MVGLLLLNGCGKASEIPAKTALSTPKSTMKTLTIYSIDSDTMSLIPVVVKKEEKTLTAEYITYLVTQNLEDEDVRVDHVEQQKNVVVVSFDSKAKPVKRCSKQMETLILNCFASSLLDNVKDCKKIIYRCSSLKSILNGSMISLKSTTSGRPPTLWWDLITADLPRPLSITSG